MLGDVPQSCSPPVQTETHLQRVNEERRRSQPRVYRSVSPSCWNLFQSFVQLNLHFDGTRPLFGTVWQMWHYRAGVACFASAFLTLRPVLSRETKPLQWNRSSFELGIVSSAVSPILKTNRELSTFSYPTLSTQKERSCLKKLLIQDFNKKKMKTSEGFFTLLFCLSWCVTDPGNVRWPVIFLKRGHLRHTSRNAHSTWRYWNPWNLLNDRFDENVQHPLYTRDIRKKRR